MAGAKETPRQKLVGLMYLVLLALLALQVSSAVIFKFEQLNKNMEHANSEMLDKNKFKLTGIETEVNKLSSPVVQMKLLQSGKTIRSKTDSLTAYIEQLKKQLITETGGFDKDGNMIGATEETKVEGFMIGINKKGKAYILKDKLDKHIAWINSLNIIQFKPIALGGNEHPVYKNKEEQKHKDFAELNFAQSPLVASLATLSELESNIINIERLSLDQIANKINLEDYKVKDLVPMVRTGSNYVIAGKKYEADLFLTAQLATEKPSMFLGNQEIDVNEQGMGKIKFSTGAESFDVNGLARKKWTARIKIKKPNGKDTIYQITQEYIVAKPTLNFQSAELPALYMNCGNKVKVNVPELGAEFIPDFGITGGSIEKSGAKGEITVIPNSNKVKINVKSDGIPIGDKDFAVRKIPLPTVQIKNGTAAINVLNGINKNDINKLVISVEANPDFKTFLPQDARYKIKKWNVILARRSSAKGKDAGSGTRLNLGNKFEMAQPGDRIVVEIEEMVRINFRNEEEEVKLTPEMKVLAVSINQ